MKRFFRSGTGGVLCGALLGALLTAALGLYLLGGAGGARSAMKYAAVLRLIGQNYVGEYDPAAVTDAAAAGAFNGLDDRWSYYMTAEEYRDYLDYSANRYQGIGVTIMKDEVSGGFTVLAVTKDGPAQLAGITVGDVILAVDGISVTEEDTTYLRELIQADFGKEALVTVRHESGEEEEIPVSCREVYTNPVSSSLLEGDTGYIRIENFREGSAATSIEAVDSLREQGASCLVFDVRSDPGGQLTELVALLDYLLPEGDLFIRMDKNGRESIETSGMECVELPMAVIVNGDSYSAAEFFAAALREYGAATVVGEQTTGKARSQVTIPLPDGSAVHISKYSYLTPQRNDLYEAGGLTPDIEVSLTEEQRADFDTGWLAPEEDPQIRAAIDALHA